MQTKIVKILNPHGLHLREAAKIVQKSKSFKSRIVFSKDNQYAESNSILQILLLAATQGSKIRIAVIGEDEKKAISELPELFSDGAGI